MKDLVSDWLGILPTHWSRSTLKRLVQTKISDGPHETPILVESGIPFISAESIKNYTVDFSLMRGYIDEETHRLYCRKVKPKRNDIFIVKSGATTGKAAIVETDEEFSIWSPLALVRADESKALPYFLLYVIWSPVFQKQMETSWSFGTQQNIGMGVIERLVCPLPPLDEQRAIAAFLDHKTTQIDALIDKKRRMIELLKEKRTALISHAVTKGLNPDAPMKDSGVPWLGQVPAHWEVKRLKFVVSMFGGGTPDTNNPLYWDGGIPWVSPKDMKEAEITGTEDTISAAGLFHSSSKLAPTGCVLIVTRSGILRHTIPVGINRVKVALNQDIKALNTKERLRPEYLMYFIQGKNRELLSIWRKEGTTVESLEHDYYANSPTPIPPIVEQDQIVKSIQGELSRLEKMSSATEEALTKLQEYRVAIISAAVTGQIDVRNHGAA